MDTVLCFESRQNYHVLRQDDVAETAPLITLQRVLTDGPTIYAPDVSVIRVKSPSSAFPLPEHAP